MTTPQRWSTFHTRLMWTVAMVAAFIVIGAAGHAYCSALVLAICTASYTEIVGLRRDGGVEQRLPGLWSVQIWYWYALALLSSLHTLVETGLAASLGGESRAISWLSANHLLVTYLAIVTGFILFLLSIRRKQIKYQFAQLAMYLITAVVVIAQGSSHVRIIHQGLVWFFAAASGVIVNDIAAYLCGCAWGRHQLMPILSPKKTVEGFLGAAVVTVVWMVAVIELLSRLRPLVCPAPAKLTFLPFTMWTDPQLAACATPYEFTYQPAQILPHRPTILYKPAWAHAALLALFASFVAPFGGLLASAVKRRHKVKDFANMIPGHGGVTDRFDCQLLMGMFTFLYLRSFCQGHRTTSVVSKIMRMGDAKYDVFCELAANLNVAVAPDICTSSGA